MKRFTASENCCHRFTPATLSSGSGSARRTVPAIVP